MEHPRCRTCGERHPSGPCPQNNKAEAAADDNGMAPKPEKVFDRAAYQREYMRKYMRKRRQAK